MYVPSNEVIQGEEVRILAAGDRNVRDATHMFTLVWLLN